jgi:hypothetical protein
MTTNTTGTTKTIEAARNALAIEMERAVDAAVDVGALKQSQWYQDRKAQLAAYDAQMEWEGM